MKKLLVLLGTLCLAFSMVTVVAAEDNSWNVYFDLGVSGSSSNTMNLPDLPGDVIGTNPLLLGASEAKMAFDGTSGYLIGGEYNFNPFKIVLEYTGNTFENTKTTGTRQPAAGGTPISNPANSDLDYGANVTLVKGAYRFINNDQFKLDGELGYLGLSVTGMSGNYKDCNFTNGGPLIGLYGNYDFSKKFSINASYGTTIGASSSMKALEDLNPKSKSSSLVAWRIKGLYMFSDEWGSYLSYSNLASSLKYTYTGLGDVTVDSTFSGFALGVNYKF